MEEPDERSYKRLPGLRGSIARVSLGSVCGIRVCKKGELAVRKGVAEVQVLMFVICRNLHSLFINLLRFLISRIFDYARYVVLEAEGTAALSSYVSI